MYVYRLNIKQNKQNYHQLQQKKVWSITDQTVNSLGEQRNTAWGCEHKGVKTWIPLPPPSPQQPSGSSPCTSPKHAVSCIGHRLVIRFLHDSIHVSMPFSQIIPPSPSPSESRSPLYTSVSLLLSCIQGHHCHLSKFHTYVLVYCIGVFLSGLLHSV